MRADRRAEAAGLAGASHWVSSGAVARLNVRLARSSDQADREGFEWASAADHCRMAYLRGLFLARGSLSVAAARTHLELGLEPDEAPILASRLAAIGLPASWRLRRGRGVVTWKKRQTRWARFCG